MSWIGKWTAFLWLESNRVLTDASFVSEIFADPDLLMHNPDSGKIECMRHDSTLSESEMCPIFDESQDADKLLSNIVDHPISIRLWLAEGVDFNVRLTKSVDTITVFAESNIGGDSQRYVHFRKRIKMSVERYFYRSLAESAAKGLIVGESKSTYVDGVFYADDWFELGGAYKLPLPELLILPAVKFAETDLSSVACEAFGKWLRIEHQPSVNGRNSN